MKRMRGDVNSPGDDRASGGAVRWFQETADDRGGRTVILESPQTRSNGQRNTIRFSETGTGFVVLCGGTDGLPVGNGEGRRMIGELEAMGYRRSGEGESQ